MTDSYATGMRHAITPHDTTLDDLRRDMARRRMDLWTRVFSDSHIAGAEERAKLADAALAAFDKQFPPIPVNP